MMFLARIVVVMSIVPALSCTRVRPGGEGSASAPSGAVDAAPVADSPGAACVEKLKEVLRIQSQADVDVSAVAETEGFYRVFARVLAGDNPLQEFFVSRDCIYMTDKMIRMDNYREQLLRDKALADCLEARQVRVFGLPMDAATNQQLAALGAFSGRLFVNCGGDMRDRCVQIGLTQFPTLIYQNQAYPGFAARPAVENMTGCTPGQIAQGAPPPPPPLPPPPGAPAPGAFPPPPPEAPPVPPKPEVGRPGPTLPPPPGAAGAAPRANE